MRARYSLGNNTNTSYSPLIDVHVNGLKIPNSKPVLIQLKFANNQRYLFVQLDAKTCACIPRQLRFSLTRENLHSPCASGLYSTAPSRELTLRAHVCDASVA